MSTEPKPPRIHGLLVLHPSQAIKAGFVSITTGISSKTERPILAGVCQHRDPQRACLILTGPDIYQLCILRVDLKTSER